MCCEPDFLLMIQSALRGSSGEHRSAILKRAVVIVAGYAAVYVRLPSEQPDQRIHVFTENCVGDDWLKPDRKDYLNKFLHGTYEDRSQTSEHKGSPIPY